MVPTKSANQYVVLYGAEKIVNGLQELEIASERSIQRDQQRDALRTFVETAREQLALLLAPRSCSRYSLGY